MTASRPWETGDHEARWDGYLIAADSPVLVNKLGLTTVEALQAAENDLVEARVAELRARPSLVSRTYDLVHLKSLHRHLFQDVYEWAGDLRTVGIAKGEGDETSFMPPFEIDRPVAHVADRIAAPDQLRTTAQESLVDELAYLYDYLNFAHPFREGNGRTQREFFSQLLEESGRRMAWNRIEMEQLHSACHLARTIGNTDPLAKVIATALFDA